MRRSIPAALTLALLAVSSATAQEPAPPKPQAEASGGAKPAPKTEERAAEERAQTQKKALLDLIRTKQAREPFVFELLEARGAQGEAKEGGTAPPLELLRVQRVAELQAQKVAVEAQRDARAAGVHVILPLIAAGRAPASPLVRGDYAQALDALETAHEKMRTTAEIDEAMRALDAAEKALMDARAALWKERERAKQPQAPRAPGSDAEKKGAPSAGQPEGPGSPGK